jgi:hypothetical protein
VRSSWCSKASVHIHGAPAGEAAAFILSASVTCWRAVRNSPNPVYSMMLVPRALYSRENLIFGENLIDTVIR